MLPLGPAPLLPVLAFVDGALEPAIVPIFAFLELLEAFIAVLEAFLEEVGLLELFEAFDTCNDCKRENGAR